MTYPNEQDIQRLDSILREVYEVIEGRPTFLGIAESYLKASYPHPTIKKIVSNLKFTKHSLYFQCLL